MKQSVIVFADVAARTAALPEPVEGMIVYLEDDDELYKWTGADWVNVVPTPDLSALIPKSTVTTAGDLIIADGASSVTRLGIGAADTILTSNGTTATWEAAAGGGGMEIISQVAASSQNSITFASIPQTYKQLFLQLDNWGHTTRQSLIMEFNSFPLTGYRLSNNNYATAGPFNTLTGSLNFESSNTSKSNYNFSFPNYKSLGLKQINSIITQTGEFNTEFTFRPLLGVFAEESPITTIRIKTTSSSFSNGTATLFGVN